MVFYEESSRPHLVLTRPFAAALREQRLAALLRGPTSNTSSSGHQGGQLPLQSTYPTLLQQRTSLSAQVSQQLAHTPNHPALMSPSQNHYLAHVLPWRSYTKGKGIKRDTRTADKEERRRRTEAEDRRKKRWNEYHRALFAHRDDFNRFHKAKKAGKVETRSVILYCVVYVYMAPRSV